VCLLLCVSLNSICIALTVSPLNDFTNDQSRSFRVLPGKLLDIASFVDGTRQ